MVLIDPEYADRFLKDVPVPADEQGKELFIIACRLLDQLRIAQQPPKMLENSPAAREHRHVIWQAFQGLARKYGYDPPNPAALRDWIVPILTAADAALREEKGSREGQ